MPTVGSKKRCNDGQSLLRSIARTGSQFLDGRSVVTALKVTSETDGVNRSVMQSLEWPTDDQREHAQLLLHLFTLQIFKVA